MPVVMVRADGKYYCGLGARVPGKKFIGSFVPTWHTDKKYAVEYKDTPEMEEAAKILFPHLYHGKQIHSAPQGPKKNG